MVGLVKGFELHTLVDEVSMKHAVRDPTLNKWKSVFPGMAVSHLAEL
jgi:hypothetical protein